MNPTTPVVSKQGQAAKERIASVRQNVDAGLSTPEARRAARTPMPKVDVSGSTVISPDSLAAPSPLQITPTPVDTATPGLQGALETAQGTTDTFLQDLTAQKTATETTKNTSMQAYLDSLMAPGEVAQTAAQYATEGGVDTIQKELDTVNNQILQEKNALRRKVERIQSSGGGLSGGAESEIDNLGRESLAKQADLYVIQMGVQGRFDSAKTIADRAVSAQLEADKQRQDVLSTLYQDNKEQFTKAEQREFETKQADRTRAIEEQAANKQATYELAIQAQIDGAPTAVVQQMMGAKSKEEALAIGGQYLGALDRQAKQASINASRLSAEKSQLEIDDIKNKQAAIEAAVANGQVILDEDQKETAYKLGKDFESESKDFKTRAEALNTVVAAADNPTAAGDLALIFAYMKMLDPNSVVREQEFANAQNAAGIPERVRAQYNNALKGERLTENTRTDFIDRATDIYNASLDQQIQLEDRYKDKAVNLFGLPENAADLVVQDIRSTGAVSDVVFGIQLNNASNEQLLDLRSKGLIP
jgi:hypothetical protein